MKKRQKTPIPEPPKHLSDRSKCLWSEIVGARVINPGRVALFQTALEALDRADEAREGIETQSLTTVTETTGAVHVNPLLKVERENRQLFSKIWGTLCLDWDAKIDDGCTL